MFSLTTNVTNIDIVSFISQRKTCVYIVPILIPNIALTCTCLTKANTTYFPIKANSLPFVRITPLSLRHPSILNTLWSLNAFLSPTLLHGPWKF